MASVMSEAARLMASKSRMDTNVTNLELDPNRAGVIMRGRLMFYYEKKSN